MQTIELSREVKAGEPFVMVIPAAQLTQHIGTYARVVIQFEPPQTETVDDELLSLIQEIQALPERLDLIRPSTPLAPNVIERISHEEVSDTVSDAWNAQWEVYEREIDREYEEDEQKFLANITKITS